MRRVARRESSALGMSEAIRLQLANVDVLTWLSFRPQSSGLSQYLSAMKRVEKALVDLNATNLRSNQKAMSDFNALLSTGSNMLQDTFKAELMQHVTPIEPLHYLTKGGHLQSMSDALRTDDTNSSVFRTTVPFPSRRHNLTTGIASLGNWVRSGSWASTRKRRQSCNEDILRRTRAVYQN